MVYIVYTSVSFDFTSSFLHFGTFSESTFSCSSCIIQFFCLKMSFPFPKAIEKYESAVSVSVDWKQVHHVCYWELMWCNR